MPVEDLSKLDQKMDLWLISELNFNINLTQRVWWPCTWDMEKITNHHVLDLPSILLMIKLHNSKPVCFSKIWLQSVWICRLNCHSCLTKNAIQEFNLCNWVQLIYQINSKVLFKIPMSPNKKLSLLLINRKMLLLICKHRFPKLRLQLRLLSIMPRLKLMLPSQQIWLRWELIY